MIGGIDPNVSISDSAYKSRLREAQLALESLAWQLYNARRQAVVLVFEGWDAAGKGGAIRRLADPLDPRIFKVHPIAAPSGIEARHHYLWRFWRRLPPHGQIAVFDRSWYGRVLVERVEGFAEPEAWRRAYGEINVFEQQQLDADTILFKFWMHISPEVQLARFEERRGTPHKAWKLTDDDWRNREKWAQYEQAVDEMLARTSTHTAPWTLVPANHKKYARVHVLETVVDGLKKRLRE